MPTFAELQQSSDDRNLIRKIQRAVAFIMPTDVDLPESLFDGATGALIDLKALGALPLGIVTPDGYDFGRDVSEDTVDALGYASEVRSDVTSVARTIGVTLLETGRKHVQELLSGTDLSNTTQDPTTGEIVYDEPDLPINREYRALIIGADGPADEQWILGRGYGRVKLSTTDNEKWGKTDPVQHAITLKVFTDNTIGSPVRHYIGGTGALKNKSVLQFDPTPVTP